MANFSEIIKAAKGNNSIVREGREKITAAEAANLYPDGIIIEAVELNTSKDGGTYYTAAINDGKYMNCGVGFTYCADRMIEVAGSVDALNAILRDSGGIKCVLHNQKSQKTGRPYVFFEIIDEE